LAPAFQVKFLTISISTNARFACQRPDAQGFDAQTTPSRFRRFKIPIKALVNYEYTYHALEGRMSVRFDDFA
jgi:hypothetical protein